MGERKIILFWYLKEESNLRDTETANLEGIHSSLVNDNRERRSLVQPFPAFCVKGSWPVSL